MLDYIQVMQMYIKFHKHGIYSVTKRGTLKVTVVLLSDSPEKTFPGGEIGAFEECMFQDALHSTQSLDHVCAVVVQVPQLAIVPLVGPPEWILLQHLHFTINTQITICYVDVSYIMIIN